MKTTSIMRRLNAFFIHLLASVPVYIMALTACRSAWFPRPLFEAMQGPAFMRLIIIAGLTLGPGLTIVAFNPKKDRKELRRDISIIVFIQFMALIYGIYLLDANRPKYLVYNSGQFNVVSSAMLDDGPLPDRIKGSLWGPVVIGAKQPSNLEEQNKILFDTLGGGHDIYSIPALLVPYADVVNEVRTRALSPNEYVAVHGGDINTLHQLVATIDVAPSELGMLPLMVNHHHAVAVINKNTGEMISYGLPNN